MMICRLCKKELRYGGAGAYFPAREQRLCPECYKKTELQDYSLDIKHLEISKYSRTCNSL